MAKNARKKKSDFVNVCGQFFQANIITMTIYNAVSQSTCFCEAFDIVFHDQKVFIIMSTPNCLSVPYCHHVSHNCRQIYTWKPYNFTLSIYLLFTQLLGGLL